METRDWRREIGDERLEPHSLFDFPAVGRRQPTTDNRQLTTDIGQPTTDNRQLTPDNRQRTTNNHFTCIFGINQLFRHEYETHFIFYPKSIA